MNDEELTEDEAKAKDPLPVDDPMIPLEGDPRDHGMLPVQETLRRSAESREQREEPNDLSGIDKEFED